MKKIKNIDEKKITNEKSDKRKKFKNSKNSQQTIKNW